MFYDLALRLGQWGISIAALFSKKSALWKKGQKGLLDRIESDMQGVECNIVWFHCASLGEFEQGRPLIEGWRREHPSDTIVLTFFSPSGYEVRKDWKGADFVYYLPLDTSRNARRFVNALSPKYAIFIKYEYWNNYTKELKKAGSRIYIVSAIFRPEYAFFKWWGGSYRKILRRFDHLFLQDNASRDLLATIGVHNVTVSGDTRFDRVAHLAENTKQLPAVERFSERAEVFITGSSWPKDDDITIDLIKAFPAIKFIIVPHEIDEAKTVSLVRRCEESGRATVRYTQCETGDCTFAEVMIIDTIGVLSSAYRYCRYAYIGGGFGAGIHNTLEAATFGLPLIFGPNYHRFTEAVALVGRDIATVIGNSSDARAWLERMSGDKELYDKTSERARQFIADNIGTTQEILIQI